MAALDVAAEEATARVAPLVVLHAISREDEEAAARRLLAVAVGRTQAEHPGLAVSGEVVVADVVDALVTRSSGASVLVMGGDGWSADLVTRVAARSSVPLVVHRPLESAPAVVLPRPVALGVAGYGDSDAPVGFAFEEAAMRGAPLLALHVWAAPADTADDRRRDDRAAAIRAHDAAEQILVAALEPWTDKYPEVRIHLAARHGLDVPLALAGASRTSQLVVIGRDRRTGPVFDVLVRRAGCPVAVMAATSVAC
jgi:hypothetical protein